MKRKWKQVVAALLMVPMLLGCFSPTLAYAEETGESTTVVETTVSTESTTESTGEALQSTAEDTGIPETIELETIQPEPTVESTEVPTSNPEENNTEAETVPEPAEEPTVSNEEPSQETTGPEITPPINFEDLELDDFDFEDFDFENMDLDALEGMFSLLAQYGVNGWKDYSAEYCVRSLYHTNPVGNSSDGALTYHCWAPSGAATRDDFAVCLESNRLWRSGDLTWNYGVVTASDISEDLSPNGAWKNMSYETRRNLILLVSYALGSQSTAQYSGSNGDVYGAVQLVAWEWINGASYTQRYSERVQAIAANLRNLVASNPDKIDPDATTVYIIWPNKQTQYNGRWVWGQTLIRIDTVVIEKPKVGNVAISKSVSGTGTKAGWRMELYADWNSASNASGCISYAYTDVYGSAAFYNLPLGTYYVREAPVSRQDRVDTTGWTLSSEIKTVSVSAGTTSNAGTVTNSAPTGGFAVTKSVSGSGSRSGWRFEAYTSSWAASAGGTDYGAYAYADENGVASFSGLALGTYYVREAPAARQDRVNANGWTLSTTVLTATVTANSNADIGTITNQAPLGGISVKKTVESPAGASGKLNDWIFEISPMRDFSSDVTQLNTDATGNANTGQTMNPGTYYIREAPYEKQTREDKDAFILDDSVCTVTVASGTITPAVSAGDYTARNLEKGRIRVRKGVANAEVSAEALKDWVFEIFDGNGEVTATVVTGADGYATSGYLNPGAYTVREAPSERQTRTDLDAWSMDETIVSVTVTVGSTSDAVQANGYTAINRQGKSLHIQKEANCSEAMKELLAANEMYSLAGAKYDVIVDGNVIETLVTDAEGKAVSQTMFQPGDSGILVETEAPAGFLLGEEPVSFTIPDGQENYTVTVQDDPTFDPPDFRLRKVDAITGKPMGGALFEGTVFCWAYYDNPDCSGTPVRTWYFATDAEGYHRYDSDWLADSTLYQSDALYQNEATGIYEIPLGSVKITEVMAPTGYAKIPELCGRIVQTKNGGYAVWQWDEASRAIVKEISGGFEIAEPQDEASFGSLSIQKTDQELGVNLPDGIHFEGCEFTVYNRSENAVKVCDGEIAEPGEICYVLTTDAEGKASTEKIFPVGTYEVRETKGNGFYSVNEDWSFTFTVAENQTSFATECANTMLSATIHVQKINTEGVALVGARFVLEWSEDGSNWKPVSRTEKFTKGGCTSAALVDDGSLTTNERGFAVFEGLYALYSYRITEVGTVNGYSLLKDPILVEKFSTENHYDLTYKVVDGYVFNLPMTGVRDMPILSACLALALVTGVTALMLRKKKEQ